MSGGYLFISERAAQSWLWLADGARQSELIEGAGKAALGASLTSAPTVIFPGQLVATLRQTLPKLRPSELREAARFAAEDSLGTSAAQIHIALPAREGGLTLACDRAALSEHIEALSAAGITPRAIYADFDCLPKDTSPVQFFEQIIVSAPGAYTDDAGWDADITARATPVDAAQLAALFETSAATNLRQGEFALRRALFGASKGGLAPWRAAAAALVFTGLAALLFDVSKVRAAAAQTKDLKAQMTQIYTDATGEAPRGNPARELRKRLDGGAQVTLGYSQLAGMALASAQSIDGVSVETMRYDAQNSRLILTLNYPAFETASAFQAAVKSRGGALSVGGVREQNGVLVGEAVLTGGGS